MGKAKPPYPAEFRHRMIEFVQADRTSAELSREFDVSGEPTVNWVAQARIGKGRPMMDKGGPPVPRSWDWRARDAGTGSCE